MPAKKGKKAYSSGTNDEAKQNRSRKLIYNENVSSVHIYEFIQNGFVENIIILSKHKYRRWLYNHLKS